MRDFGKKVIHVYDGAFDNQLCSGLIRHYEAVVARPKYDPYYVAKFEFKGEILKDIEGSLQPYLDAYKYDQWVERDYEHYLKDCQLLKYLEGDRRWMHAGEPTERELITLSTLVFLNDDYEGGELCFPDFDMVIKPKTGTVVIFPSCYMFPHEVKTVEKGTRYTLATAFGYKTLGVNTGYKRGGIYGDKEKNALEAKEVFNARRKKIME